MAGINPDITTISVPISSSLLYRFLGVMASYLMKSPWPKQKMKTDEDAHITCPSPPLLVFVKYRTKLCHSAMKIPQRRKFTQLTRVKIDLWSLGNSSIAGIRNNKDINSNLTNTSFKSEIV